MGILQEIKKNCYPNGHGLLVSFSWPLAVRLLAFSGRLVSA
jgi:hypothetical protein